ncbi:MAG: nucleoside phosphorylase [Candidatus Hodarchaeota archaeon]
MKKSRKRWNQVTDEIEYHVQCKKDDFDGRYMLVVGDPGRSVRISKMLDNAKEVAHNREYHTFKGFYESVPVAVASCGIGCPSTAIGLEEFGRCGIDTFIRVGTSGGLQKFIEIGDIVIANGAVRDEGTSASYIFMNYPAICDLDTTLALRTAAQKLGYRYHLGIIHSKDAFYTEHPDLCPMHESVAQRWKIWERANVYATEMEISTMAVLGSLRGWRIGCVVAVVGSTVSGEPVVDHMKGQKEAIKVALQALKILNDQDNS